MRARSSLVILLILVAFLPGSVAAQAPAAVSAMPSVAGSVATSPTIESVTEAVAQDAAVYAEHYGVSLQEAQRRLQAQEESVAVTSRFAVIFADRLAGITIEHRPVWRIVVLLTGTGPVPDERIYAGGMNVPIVFRTGALATHAQIVAAITAHQAQIRTELPFAVGMGADQRAGELAVTVRPADAERYGVEALQAEVAALAGVPARIDVLQQRETNAAVYGGARVSGINPNTGRHGACTTGFVVTDGLRTGVVTAAHCPNELDYRDSDGDDLPLSLLGKWGTAYQDVQVNIATAAMAPLFHPDAKEPALRPLTGARRRADTRPGDFVCHSSERDGYSCAEISYVDYAPHPNVCGMLCAPSWVTVAGPSCGPGDSGGPVFNGTIAFGIDKGVSRDADGACGFYFYMSTDYLPVGWALLHAPPTAVGQAQTERSGGQPNP